MEAATTPVALRAGELELRPGDFLALAAGRPLRLTVRELQLLVALVERAGRIVSRAELYGVVWGDGYRRSDRSVDVYVAKLRHKLEQAAPSQRYIHTHFGFGYRFWPEPASPAPSSSHPDGGGDGGRGGVFTSFSQPGDKPITDSPRPR